jgi:hypothetical protein
MSKQNKTTLKGFFETGKIPTQGQYTDLIDSQINARESGTQIIQSSLSSSGNFIAEGNITASNISASGVLTVSEISSSTFTLTGPITASIINATSKVSSVKFESRNQDVIQSNTGGDQVWIGEIGVTDNILHMGPTVLGGDVLVTKTDLVSPGNITRCNFITSSFVSASVIRAISGISLGNELDGVDDGTAKGSGSLYVRTSDSKTATFESTNIGGSFIYFRDANGNAWSPNDNFYMGVTSNYMRFHTDTGFFQFLGDNGTLFQIDNNGNTQTKGDIVGLGHLFISGALTASVLSASNTFFASTFIGDVIKSRGYLRVETNITCSGDISASGNIVASNYRIEDSTEGDAGGKELVGYSSNTLRYGFDSGLQIYTYGKDSDNRHYYYGDITASNNISASANIYADEFYVEDQRIRKANNVVNIPGGLLTSALTASGTISASGDITCEDITATALVTLGSNRYRTQNDNFDCMDGGLEANGDITASGNIWVSGSLGWNNVYINSTGGEITSSGNISSSGIIYAQSYGIWGKYGYALSSINAGTLRLAADQLKTKIGGTNIELDAPVTASIISSSGHISASNIISTDVTVADDLFITDDIMRIGDADPSIKLSSDFKVEIGDVAGTGTETILTIDNPNRKISTTHQLDVTGNITASGNIEATSGTVSASYFTGGVSRFERMKSTPGSAGVGYGDIMTFGLATATTAGKIYYMNGSGGWTIANADAAADSTGLLAMALDDNSKKGMLLRGECRIAAIDNKNSTSFGKPVYLDTTDGDGNMTAPSTGGHIKRIIGHSLMNNVSGPIMWFNPDNYWEVVS